jgi:hypothetical protein
MGGIRPVAQGMSVMSEKGPPALPRLEHLRFELRSRRHRCSCGVQGRGQLKGLGQEI